MGATNSGYHMHALHFNSEPKRDKYRKTLRNLAEESGRSMADEAAALIEAERKRRHNSRSNKGRG